MDQKDINENEIGYENQGDTLDENLRKATITMKPLTLENRAEFQYLSDDMTMAVLKKWYENLPEDVIRLKLKDISDMSERAFVAMIANSKGDLLERYIRDKDNVINEFEAELHKALASGIGDQKAA